MTEHSHSQTESRHLSRRRRGATLWAALALATSMLAALSTSGQAAGATSGGSVVVLESTAGSFPNLDPATNTSDYADLPLMDAIYGNLFEFASGGKVVPDMASGYKFADGGRDVVITLRKGIKFSDGTPFNASAVAFNIRRDLEPQYACPCAVNFPVSSITTPNAYTVVLHLSKVYTPIINAFYGWPPNWIASPTALKKMGQKAFELTPVAAGPFEVVSDEPSAKLVLKKNPTYFQSGHPYLNSLTFEAIGSDETAYNALLSGQAQVYQSASTFSIINTAAKKLTVSPDEESVAPSALELNTTIAPFNNLLAREAIYYATDPGPLLKSLLTGRGTLTETPTVPGGLYAETHTPGYRTYNLAKAKALVSKLGGLSFTLVSSTEQSSIDQATALKSEWAQAGITATISPQSLLDEVQGFKTNSWQMEFAYLGGYDPPLAMPGRYASTGAFSGVKDPKVDSLMNEASSTLNQTKAKAAATELFHYISQQAYSPFLWVTANYVLTVHSVSGPGLTNTSYQEVLWQDVRAK